MPKVTLASSILLHIIPQAADILVRNSLPKLALGKSKARKRKSERTPIGKPIGVQI